MDHQVRFLPSQRSIRVATGTNLLEAARLAGVPLESGCGGWGTCASCGVHIVEASCGVPPESAGEREAKRTSSIDEDQRLACFLSVEQDLSVTTLDWGETCRGAEKSEAEEV